MALIQCPDCGNQVSDVAPACPKCGRPFIGTAQAAAASSLAVGTERPIELTAKRFKLITLVSVLSIVLGIVIAIGSSQAGEREASGFAGFLIVGGFISYIVNRIRIWWHHK